MKRFNIEQNDVQMRGGTAAEEPLATIHALLGAIPHALVLIDENDRVLFANADACAILGKAPKEIHDRLVNDVSPTLPIAFHQIIAAHCVDYPHYITMTEVARNGIDARIEWQASMVDTPRPLAVCVLREVAALIGNEAQVRADVLRYGRVLHALDEGVVIRNAEGRVMYINPAAYRILQLNPETLDAGEKSQFADWLFADGAGNSLTYDELPYANALRTREPSRTSLLYVWVPHTQASLWMSISAVPLYADGNAKPYAVISTFTDITELKTARDLLSQTQSIGQIGGYELQFGDSRLVWTDEMYRLFEVPRNTQVTLELLQTLLTPSSLQLLQAEIDVVRGGETSQEEFEIVTARGNRRWLRSKSRPVLRDDAVLGVTGMCQDITDRKRLEDELRRRARTDALTGIANREHALEELEARIADATNDVGPTLLYVDIDRFAVVNEVLGPRSGDRLLAKTAQRLCACVPEGALCARFAGTEFLVLLPALIGDEKVGEIAETINARLARPFENDGEAITMTVSIGVARYAHAGDTAQRLLQHAMAAMSNAKRNGRGTWRFYSPSIERRLRDERTAVADLKNALRDGQLRLVYQPQIELCSGAVIAAEALLRWDHPERGELHPLSFVQLAESCGEIVAIGAWVIDRACRQLRSWRDEGLAIERIAVNVAHRQMLSESFLQMVSATLRRHALAGGALDLEIAEQVLLDGTSEMLALLQHLRDLGVSITVDGFGECYSSLNYLRRLPIDGLKISYDFMHRVPASSVDAVLCKAIIEVGRVLDLGMVASGVESESQRAFLLEHGMQVGQGHLFSAPLDASQFMTFARVRRSTGSHFSPASHTCA